MLDIKTRGLNLLFDVFIGDVQEVDVQHGFLKLASGVLVGFD